MQGFPPPSPAGRGRHLGSRRFTQAKEMDLRRGSRYVSGMTTRVCTTAGEYSHRREGGRQEVTSPWEAEG